MDDNATCHRTLAVQDCLDSEGIQRLVWPARSPDLNPIENVWDALGRQVAGRNCPPSNKNTFIRALTEEWDKLSQQLLNNVMQTVFARYWVGNIIKEELIAITSLLITTKGTDICTAVRNSLAEKEIDLKRIVSVTTDGTPNMVVFTIDVFSSTIYLVFPAGCSQKVAPDWTLGVKASLCKTAVDCLAGNSSFRQSTSAYGNPISIYPTAFPFNESDKRLLLDIARLSWILSTELCITIKDQQLFTKRTHEAGKVRFLTFSPCDRSSLAVKIIDSWLACHEFELNASEDRSCSRCMLNLTRLRRPPVVWCGS
ncbi:DUF4371 domain-containing protein [Trichonephila clavipes]|uniref:DUF4371 domain-containing protein n=1 Tax=Trichonephila clavipes TaxID=2585209 RepID=A0A8X6S8A4_TRICX|nr:DUF4371 domain-containing protein [Trichonephila clavipes]